MKYSSRAIALSCIKYGENSIIAKIFTEEKGLQSFIVKRVRAKKAKKKLGFFQSLQLLTINATHLPKNNLQYISEIALEHTQITNGIDMKKNFLCIFVAEVISKVLLETEKDKWCMTAIWIGRSQGNYKCHPEFLFESLNEIPQGTIQQGEEAHSGV